MTCAEMLSGGLRFARRCRSSVIECTTTDTEESNTSVAEDDSSRKIERESTMLVKVFKTPVRPSPPHHRSTVGPGTCPPHMTTLLQALEEQRGRSPSGLSGIDGIVSSTQTTTGTSFPAPTTVNTSGSETPSQSHKSVSARFSDVATPVPRPTVVGSPFLTLNSPRDKSFCVEGSPKPPGIGEFRGSGGAHGTGNLTVTIPPIPLIDPPGRPFGKRAAESLLNNSGISMQTNSQIDADLALPSANKRRSLPLKQSPDDISETQSSFGPLRVLKEVFWKPLVSSISPSGGPKPNPFVGPIHPTDPRYQKQRLLSKWKQQQRPHSPSTRTAIVDKSPSELPGSATAATESPSPSVLSLLARFPNFLGSQRDSPRHQESVSPHENRACVQPSQPSKADLVPTFTLLPDLASEELGGRILFATDDFFADASNLLKSEPPQWKEGEYTEFGKWMDGWLTRRRRVPVHDWCIIQLGCPAIIHGCEIDTTHFSGHYAPYCSIEAAYFPDLGKQIANSLKNAGHPPYKAGVIGVGQSPEAIEAVHRLLQEQSSQDEAQWKDLVEMTPLGSGNSAFSKHYHKAIEGPPKIVTHLRLNLFPDGGIARLRVYGVAECRSPATGDLLLSSVCNGGLILGCSNQHFGDPRNLLLDSLPKNMSSGWETARRPDRRPYIEATLNANHTAEEWVVIRLGARALLTRIEIDTKHFLGDYPEYVLVRGVDVTEGCTACFNDIKAQRELFSTAEVATCAALQNKAGTLRLTWKTVISKSAISPGTNHVFGGSGSTSTTTMTATRKRRPTTRRKTQTTTPTRRAAKDQAEDVPDGITPSDEQDRRLDGDLGPFTHLCFTLYPDGGIARLRVWGTPVDAHESTGSGHRTHL